MAFAARQGQADGAAMGSCRKVDFAADSARGTGPTLAFQPSFLRACAVLVAARVGTVQGQVFKIRELPRTLKNK